VIVAGSFPWYFGVVRTRLSPVLLAFACILVPTRAWADVTAFVGANPSPSNRTVTGFAAGFSILVVGIEFEYSNSREDSARGAPSLKTGMANLLVLTPSISGFQFYGTVGGGAYQERLAVRENISFGTNVGGGVKIALAGPVRLRLDYRIFALKGDPIETTPQRFYAGVNFAF
jgi:opacity protein-like surface antigen